MRGITIPRLAALAAVPLVASLMVVLFVSGTAGADASCRSVSGKFTLTAVTGTGCSSSIGICADGTYKGSIRASAEFVGTTLLQTIDTPTTGVVILTGDNAFTLTDGTLLTKDAIALKTTGAGDFGEVDTIVGGTGAWAGATGTLRAQGTFTAEAGGAGVYEGEVCVP